MRTSRLLGLIPLFSAATVFAQANTWTPRGPGAPRVRQGAMVYDAAHRRFVFAGGVSSSGGLFGGTWAYELAADRWTDLAPASGYAPAEDSPGLAADDSGRILMFDGMQTSLYDPIANAWSILSPSPAPSSRTGVALVWDPVGQRALSFGGSAMLSVCPPWGTCNDLWAFDFGSATWTLLAGSIPPRGRSRPQVGFDPSTGRFILFSGDGHDNINSLYPNDTWGFDPATDTWIQRFPSDALPIERAGGRLAYAGSGALILFGGRSVVFEHETELGDTWIYLPDRNRWTAAAPPLSPGVRTDFAMAFDDSNRSLVLVDAGETWAYDFRLAPSLDAAPPTTPQDLWAGGGFSGSALPISWSASSDDTQVGGYRIYQDGYFVGATTGTNSYVYASVGQYEFQVVSYDLVGNTSGRSAPASATVISLPCDNDCGPHNLLNGPLGSCKCSLSGGAYPDRSAIAGAALALALALAALGASLWRRRETRVPPALPQEVAKGSP